MNFVEPIRNKKDVTRLVQWAFNYKKMYGVILAIGFSSGLRISDVLNLTVKDINSTNRITIHEKKTGKRKSFVLKDDVAKLVKDWAKNCEYYLFIGKKGAKLDRIAVYRVIKRGCQELGIEGNIATHSLRKTVAYSIYRQTNDIALVMDILNHANLKTTFRYLSLTQDRIDNAFLNLDMKLV